MTDLSLFRFSYPAEVRYGDLDALAHVNNAKYFTYMESARLRYFVKVIEWTGERGKLGVILARTACDFKIPLVYGDSARVLARVTRVGNKSFDFEYVILREADQAIAALGTSVQVAYDYRAAESRPVPDEWREKMVAFEPGLKSS